MITCPQDVDGKAVTTKEMKDAGSTTVIKKY